MHLMKCGLIGKEMKNAINVDNDNQTNKNNCILEKTKELTSIIILDQRSKKKSLTWRNSIFHFEIR